MRTETRPLVLSTATVLADARAALDTTGEAVALVTDRGTVIGVVTIDDLERGAAADAATLGDIMWREIVSIEPRTDLRRTLRAYRKAAWGSAIRRRPGQLDL